jgi:hypothetical protein
MAGGTRWAVPVMIGLAATVAVGLAACAHGQGSGPSPGDTSASMPGVDASAGPPVTAGSTGGASATSPAGTGPFVLAEGEQRQVCGITLAVKFIPPSATGGSQDQAFLVGGATSTGDQPAPSTLAPARPGGTATVLDRTFRVIAVDVVNARVTLEAVC